MKKIIVLAIVLAIVLLVISGCRPPMLIDKATPMYIHKGIGWVEIYVYDSESNSLVSGGWVSIKELEDKTAVSYDWDKYFLRNK